MSAGVIAARLNEAAAVGARVTILYRDTGRRESRYTVLPIAASTRVLRARDVASGRVRVFLLAHLEIAPHESFPEATAPPSPPRAPMRTLEDVFASVADELKALGWHVRLTAERLSVHPSHPGGKPVSLAAAFVANNAVAGRTARRTSRRRPWTVRVPGLPKARTFAALDTAVALFMAQARSHAPERRERKPRRRRAR